MTTPELKKPTPTAKIPNGQGITKGDELLRRLRLELKYDPVKELVELAKSAKTNSSEKIKIASELLSYYQPKVKAVELNPNAGEVIKVNISFPEETPKGLSEIAPLPKKD